MATTQSPDTDSLFSSTPQLRAQLVQLQTTFSQQMNKPTFLLKPLGVALRLKTNQKKQVSTIQRNIHKQLYNSFTDTPTEQAILLSQSASHTGAHLKQPSSEAYEAEDRCFRVSVARRLMLPHLAAANPANVVQFCPNKSVAGVICNKPVDPKQHHCYGCRFGEGVDRRHAAVGRCLADVIQSHSGVKVFIEQEVPALTRVVNGRTEHARMDLVFNLNGSVTYLDVSIVAPFSCNPSLVSAASTKPGPMAKRAEKIKFDRYPHVNLVPFILETTGRPGPHAKKFISYLLRDADNPPLAIRDTWSTIQSVLHSAISKQQLTAAVTRPTVTIVTPSILSVPHSSGCKYRPIGNAHRVFSLKPTAAVPCGPAVTSLRPTMTSTTLTTISFSCLRTLPLRPLYLRACLRLMSYT